MSRLRNRDAGLICALLAVWLAAAPGCTRRGPAVELVSYKDPYFPESRRIEFEQCAYRVDAGGDLHIVGRASLDLDEAHTGQITQFLHARLCWRPQPGRTFANSTTSDASIRYVIATPTGAALYTGTAFVYPKRQRNETLTVEIESANLRLESLVGQPVEVLGDARLSGKLVARRDAHATVDLVRQLDLHAAGQ